MHTTLADGISDGWSRNDSFNGPGFASTIWVWTLLHTWSISIRNRELNIDVEFSTGRTLVIVIRQDTPRSEKIKILEL